LGACVTTNPAPPTSGIPGTLNGCTSSPLGVVRTGGESGGNVNGDAVGKLVTGAKEIMGDNVSKYVVGVPVFVSSSIRYYQLKNFNTQYHGILFHRYECDC
jgi:hypothetical protein